MSGTSRAPWRQAVPEFLHFLESRFNHKVRSYSIELGYDIYRVDFSDWKLRFSDHTPVIAIRASDIAAQTAQALGQSISDVIRGRSLAQYTPILLVDGEGEPLRDYFRTSFFWIIVLDHQDQSAITSSRRPTSELLLRLSRQLPLAALAPYETSQPVTGSRFFGRESEIRRVVSNTDANFAIMGIRRIGKTSLLHEIRERLLLQAQEADDERAEARIIYMDCSLLKSTADFMQEVVRRLQPQELYRIGHRHFPLYFPDFLSRMARRYNGRLIFLLDEFDDLLTAISTDMTILEALHASSTSKDARFIVAGFRRLLQETSNQNSPFFNFAKPLRLKEFTRNEAAAMIVEPMRNLGIQIERSNEIVDRVIGETSGQPNLIQYYCSILIEILDRQEQRLLSPDILFHVYDNEDFRAFLLNTFMDNTSHLEKAIVFTILLKFYPELQELDLETMDVALQDHNIATLLSDMDQACKNLELAGIFVKQNRFYQFAMPVFPKMLMDNYNVPYLMRKVIEEGIW